ncbi:MAG TPA: hypothetical protein VHC70_00370 [Phycisphaerales bacterium]|jgi:hypothetical protein|nr:hypothetical protein [Phycisphaerales bacterium]
MQRKPEERAGSKDVQSKAKGTEYGKPSEPRSGYRRKDKQGREEGDPIGRSAKYPSGNPYRGTYSGSGEFETQPGPG